MANEIPEPAYIKTSGRRTLKPLMMSIVGSVLSVFVPIIIFMSSRQSGWASIPNFLLLAAGGVVAVALGIAALITNNKNRPRSITAIILAAVSITFGSLVLVLLVVIMVFIFALAASMR